ncbi:MAG: (4Fe-4S)-binding protein [Spirochaetes bacterium]|nr:(4Fe-4S)-binding protein [Spirochaetota bacterium]
MIEKKKKIIKTIKIDLDKCNGCRACEMICAAYHAEPKYSSINPARARIRMIREPIRDIYVPVYAGETARAECMGRDKYIIDGKEYDECAFCRSACPSRDAFKEPDSGLPLKCDMCEDNTPGEDPLCVQWCINEALIYEEREEEETEEEIERQEDIETGLESLIDLHGIDSVINALGRLSRKGSNGKAAEIAKEVISEAVKN